MAEATEAPAAPPLPLPPSAVRRPDAASTSPAVVSAYSSLTMRGTMARSRAANSDVLTGAGGTCFDAAAAAATLRAAADASASSVLALRVTPRHASTAICANA